MGREYSVSLSTRQPVVRVDARAGMRAGGWDFPCFHTSTSFTFVIRGVGFFNSSNLFILFFFMYIYIFLSALFVKFVSVERRFLQVNWYSRGNAKRVERFACVYLLQIRQSLECNAPVVVVSMKILWLFGFFFHFVTLFWRRIGSKYFEVMSILSWRPNKYEGKITFWHNFLCRRLFCIMKNKYETNESNTALNITQCCLEFF